jgi:hypothetical protein
MNSDALFRPTKNSMTAIDAFKRTTTCTGFAFIAGHRHFIKIWTACSLVEISRIRRHIANLSGRTGKYCLGEERKILSH